MSKVVISDTSCFIILSKGLIIKAKLDGVIPSVKPLLQKIKLTNFRLSTDLEQYALKEAGEF